MARTKTQHDWTSTTQWLGVYHHRHGQDYALFDHQPTDDEMAAFWGDDFEPEREDEYFDTYGPLKLALTP